MTDDLRTRIAHTIYGDGNHTPWNRSLELADLIIWEIGLHPVETLNRQYVRWVTGWRNNPDYTPKPSQPPYCQRCGIPHTTPCKRPNHA